MGHHLVEGISPYFPCFCHVFSMTSPMFYMAICRSPARCQWAGIAVADARQNGKTWWDETPGPGILMHIEIIHTEMIWDVYTHIYIYTYIYICIDINIYIYELWLYCISKDIEWDPNTVLHLFFPWFLWLFPGCWRRWPSITWAGYWNHCNNPLRVTYSNKVRFSVWMCLSVLLFPLWIYWFVCIYCIWY